MLNRTPQSLSGLTAHWFDDGRPTAVLMYSQGRCNSTAGLDNVLVSIQLCTYTYDCRMQPEKVTEGPTESCGLDFRGIRLSDASSCWTKTHLLKLGHSVTARLPGGQACFHIYIVSVMQHTSQPTSSATLLCSKWCGSTHVMAMQSMGLHQQAQQNADA